MSRSHCFSENAAKNAGLVVKLCQRELTASGFNNRKRKTLWRRTNVKFDVIKFDVIPKSRCEKWGTLPGSFILALSCLFPFLPRAGYLPGQIDYQPEDGYGQVRLAVERGIRQPSVKPPNIWWPGATTSEFKAVVEDVLRVINESGTPFFSRFEDTKELLRTFLEDDDAIDRVGIWDIGRNGSPTRLLYTGFAAIECGEWSLAISSLQTCREKISSFSESVREQVETEILPYVQEGLSCAEQKTPWLGTTSRTG